LHCKVVGVLKAMVLVPFREGEGHGGGCENPRLLLAHCWAGGVWFGYALYEHDPGSALPALLLACVGAIVGAVAGAAGEIVAAQRRLAESTHWKQMSKTYEGVD